MEGVEKTREAEALLSRLHDMLVEQGERNWIRGVEAARSELASGTDVGYENAKSIYFTMVKGGRGFAEYNVWDDDEEIRIRTNRSLDEIREALWQIFTM
ncbi:hypothetical protein [Hyphomonas sp.]|uniref:hypothetical protein n=1 Tax=Hyphomonas sp. TaxID=87 RepID=UPI0025C35CEF|nr:hypothetical protein [Hyphomonas sp.]